MPSPTARHSNRPAEASTAQVAAVQQQLVAVTKKREVRHAKASEAAAPGAIDLADMTPGLRDLLTDKAVPSALAEARRALPSDYGRRTRHLGPKPKGLGRTRR